MSTISQRFWVKVDKRGDAECRPWLAGCTGAGGYGTFGIRGQGTMGAHRLAWVLTYGLIPPGLCVLHHCDNPPCVNPAHLYLGTPEDNAADRERRQRRIPATGDAHGSRTHPERLLRGDQHPARLRPERLARGERHGSRTRPERIPRGENNASAKLTEADVIAIRAASDSQRALAHRYGVTQPNIGSILRRKTWRHIPPTQP